jgi:membrane protease YdiL (CAAX protease family)
VGVRRFYLISFIFSWSIWITGAFLWQSRFILLIAIGGLGPVIALLYVLFQTYDRAGRKNYLQRMTNISNIPASVWLITLLLPVMLVLFAAGFVILTEPESISMRAIFLDGLASAGGLFFVFHVFFGPLPEELAWRGYAYHELLKTGVLKAQLVVASLWAIWHIPLFFIPGSYQAGLGLFTAGFWFFFINIYASSFIIGWLYLKSKQSIFIVFLFHYMINVTGELINLGDTGETVKHILLALSGVTFFMLSAAKTKIRNDKTA